MANPIRPAANANPNTGRMGFRYEWEDLDERPCIVYTEPPLDALWLKAVRMAPREQYPNLSTSDYLAEIGKIVTGLRPSGELVKSMGER